MSQTTICRLLEPTGLDAIVFWLLYCPPWWLSVGIYVVGAGVVAAVAVRLHRRGLSEDALRGVADRAWALACCGGAAWVLSSGSAVWLGLAGGLAGGVVWWLTRGWVMAETLAAGEQAG